MGLLDALIFGVRTLRQAGSDLPLRSKLNFTSGATLADNPATDATDVTITQQSQLVTSMPSDLWTAPPTAANWHAMYGSPAAPVDVAGLGAVTFNVAVNTNGTWYKTLVSSSGARVLTFFAKPQIVPNSTSDTVHYSVGIGGASKYIVINQEYNATAMKAVVQRLNNADGSFDANMGGTPSADATTPFVPSWWRLTLDDTNLTIERCPIGSVYYTFLALFAHGCGPITRAVINSYSTGAAPNAACKVALLSFSGDV